MRVTHTFIDTYSVKIKAALKMGQFHKSQF